MTQPRFYLRAFVTDAGEPHIVDFDYGWNTFGQIFLRRGPREQFALADTVDHNVVVWDFYNLDPLWSMSTAPPPWVEFADFDSALMAATLTGRTDGE